MNKEKYEKTADGKHIKWAEISRHSNTKACKPWIAKVEDYDTEKYKYNWKQDFLSRTYPTNSDKPKINVNSLKRGDIIRVSGASHNNDYTTCFEVIENNSEFVVKELSDEEAIEKLTERDTEREEIIDDIVETLREKSTEELKTLRGEVKANE